MGMTPECPIAEATFAEETSTAGTVDRALLHTTRAGWPTLQKRSNATTRVLSSRRCSMISTANVHLSDTPDMKSGLRSFRGE